MNTIDGLKALPNIIKILLDDRDEIQLKIDACYKPFRDIIKEVLVVARGGSVYINDIDIGVGDNNVCFTLRYYSDDECEGTYSYPIEAFVSTDTLVKYIMDLNERKAQEENNMTWRLQYAEELKREVEYHRNKEIEYFRLLGNTSKETLEHIDKLLNPFNPDKIPSNRYEYKVGDVLLHRWNFNIARIIKVSGDWYYFDRIGMNDCETTHTMVHKNSVEPEYLMRKVDIDLPVVTFTEKIEVL